MRLSSVVRKYFSISIAVFLPFFCFAEFWITEIHFNPDGSDSGYEWIEVHNNSGSTQNLDGYVFRENGVNHGLKIHTGDFNIASGERVIIADKPDKFLANFPGYTGTLIDSAFSLNNTGEKLELLDSGKNIRFEVTYSADTAPGDDGSSIGLIDNVWLRVTASPGAVNTHSPEATEQTDNSTSDETADQNQDQESDSDSETSQAETTPDTTATPNNHNPETYVHLKNPDYSKKLITVDAGADRTVMAGADYQFSGQVFGLTGEAMDSPEVFWNWGDGNTGEGLQDLHTYLYPGVYTAVIRATAQKHTARDYIQVTVIPPSIVIADVALAEQTISINNISSYVLELSGYEIVNSNDEGKEYFTFPNDTFIQGGQTIIIDAEKSGLTLEADSVVSFRYPKGIDLSSYDVQSETKQQISEQITTLKQDLQTLQTQSAQEPSKSNTTTMNKSYPTPNTSQPGLTYAVVYQAAQEQIDGSGNQNDEMVASFAMANSNSQNQNSVTGNTVITPNQEAAVGNSFAVDNSPFFYLQVVLIIMVLLATTGIAYLHHRQTNNNKTDAERESDDISVL